MQKVVSIPNADFTVPPVTSIAQSIISKRYVKIPINTPGTYGHNRSTLPYTIYSDWGDNENFVDLYNTHLEFDFTGTWQDPNIQHYPVNALTPSFDQSSQALLNRMRIATSQGMTIEEIQNYNMLSNIIQSYTMNPTQKHMNLTNLANYQKNIYGDKGTNEFLDARRGSKGLIRNAPPHQFTQRMILKWLHSSVLNRIHMLPLFNFRNGIRLEADFEDVNRAFVYQDTSSTALISNNHFVPQLKLCYPQGDLLAGVPSKLQDTIPNWFVGPGNITTAGFSKWVPTYTAAGVGNEGFRTRVEGIQSYNGMFDATYHVSVLNNVAASPLRYYKNTLYIADQQTIRNVINTGTVAYPITTLIGSDIVTCIPINIYEKGELKWRGFTVVSSEELALTNMYATSELCTVAANPPVYQLYTTGGGLTLASVNTVAGAGTDIFSAVKDADAAGQELVDDTGITDSVQYAAFPLFSWDIAENLLYNNKRDDTIPYKLFNVRATANEVAFTPAPEMVDYLNCLTALQAEVQFEFESTFQLQHVNGAFKQFLSTNINSKDPRALELSSLMATGQKLLKWNYSLTNIEWRLTLIKPASDVFTQYTNAFQKDVGIPYPFTRVFQFSKNFSGSQLTGMQQIQVPMSVRSLNSLFVVMGDPQFTSYNTSNQIMFLPALSTFMRRGCNRIELVTGGTQTPAYRVQMETRGGVEHIPLLENFFGLDNTNGFTPAFDKIELDANRNLIMAASGGFDNTASSWSTLQAGRNYPSPSISGVPITAQSISYTDSSKFVWGVNLAKKDKQGFASGLDTTMIGSLVLNFYFMQDAAPTVPGSTYDPGFDWQRNITVNIYGFADALFTTQNDANMVRW